MYFYGDNTRAFRSDAVTLLQYVYFVNRMILLYYRVRPDDYEFSVASPPSDRHRESYNTGTHYTLCTFSESRRGDLPLGGPAISSSHALGHFAVTVVRTAVSHIHLLYVYTYIVITAQWHANKSVADFDNITLYHYTMDVERRRSAGEFTRRARANNTLLHHTIKRCYT